MGRNRKKQKAKAKAVSAETAAANAAKAQAKANASDLSHPDGMKAAGNAAFAEGDYDGAVAWFTSAIQADPSQKVYFSNRSAAYLKIGGNRSYRRALADAQECVKLDAEWGKGHFRLAGAYKLLHRVPEAKAAIKQAMLLDESNTQYAELAEELAKMKDADFMPEGSDDDGEEQDKFELLEEWLTTPTADESNVAMFPLLYMKRYSENNRGVHCRVDVPPETRIMTIPRRYLITVEMGKATDIGKAMVSNNVDITAQKHCYLCVYAMADRRNPDSYYQPYYKILPTSYPNMPIFWSEEELSWLQGSYILTQVSDRKRNISADMEEISSVAPEFGEFSLEEFMWARMMVASRNFGVTIDEVKTDALVPYADMLNHYRPRETSWTFSQEEYCFTITSLKTLKKGQQVYDSYGKKCNSRFLLNYGFAIESNRDPSGQCHDEVRVRFHLKSEEEDPSYHLKQNLLNGTKSFRDIRPSSWYPHKTSQEAFSFLRFVHARDTEVMLLPQIGYGTDLQKNPIKPISTQNEICVLRTLRDTYLHQLSKYERSMEADQKTIEDKVYEFGSNHRNAIVHLINEKRVCHHFIELARVCIPLLQMQWKDCKKVTNKLFREANDIKRYITAVVHPLVKKESGTAMSAARAARSAELAAYLMSPKFEKDGAVQRATAAKLANGGRPARPEGAAAAAAAGADEAKTGTGAVELVMLSDDDDDEE